MTKESAKKFVDETTDRLQSLENEGLKFPEVEQLFDKAKKAVADSNASLAVPLINELGGKFKNINQYLNEFISLISICERNFKLGREMGVDVSEFEELLEEAREQFCNEKLTSGVELAKRALKRSQDILFVNITDEIKAVYKQFKQLPKQVMQSNDIQQRFKVVDETIQKDDFIRAWKITLELKGIKDRLAQPIISKIQNQAKDCIIDFQNKIDESRAHEVDLTDAKEVFSELVERMRTAKEISDFKEVIEYTQAGIRALERAQRRKSRSEEKIQDIEKTIEKVVNDINELRGHCAIPNSIEENITEAETALGNGDFDAAIDNVNACGKKLEKLRAGSEPNLELRFDTSNLQPNLWNRTMITIENNGLASAKDISFTLTGPFEVRRLPTLDELEYNKSQAFEIGLKPEGAGDVPVDIDIKYNRTLDGKSYHEHQELWLNIIVPGQTTPDTGPTPGQVPESFDDSVVLCIYCNDTIPDSAPIFKCKCGTIYHLDCVTDLNICLNCDRDIQKQVGSVAEDEKA
jgi:hypothetical protein